MTMGKRARKEPSIDARTDGAVRKKGGIRDGKDGMGLVEEVDGVGPTKRFEVPMSTLAGAGKPWSFQAGVHGEARDRGIAPPALPIPIASFTI